LHAADSQLNSAVQGKLDSLKRAVDLMDESTAKLTKLSINISRIDEKIAITNTGQSSYLNLIIVTKMMMMMMMIVTMILIAIKMMMKMMMIMMMNS
jgi:hypothetical protein